MFFFHKSITETWIKHQCALFFPVAHVRRDPRGFQLQHGWSSWAEQLSDWIRSLEVNLSNNEIALFWLSLSSGKHELNAESFHGCWLMDGAAVRTDQRAMNLFLHSICSNSKLDGNLLFVIAVFYSQRTKGLMRPWQRTNKTRNASTTSQESRKGRILLGSAAKFLNIKLKSLERVTWEYFPRFRWFCESCLQLYLQSEHLAAASTRSAFTHFLLPNGCWRSSVTGCKQLRFHVGPPHRRRISDEAEASPPAAADLIP